MSLSDMLLEYLDEITPKTDEKDLLNEMTKFQIEDFSFRENSTPRDTINGNCLVPHFLYMEKKDRAWRYPSSFTTRFLVRKSKSNSCDIHLKLRFWIPTALIYRERRQFGRSIQFRQVSNIKIKIPDPEKFFKVELDGHKFSLLEEMKFTPRSSTPIFFEKDISFSLEDKYERKWEISPAEKPEQYIRIYDEQKDQMKSLDYEKSKYESLDLDFKQRNPRFAVIAKKTGVLNSLLLVYVSKQDDVNAFQITIKLKNITAIGSAWHLPVLLSTMVFPHIYVDVEGGEILLPPQQHLDRLKESLSGNGEKKWDLKLSYTDQINCVTAKSTVSPNRIAIAPFGTFDTLRITPRPGPSSTDILQNVQSFLKNSTVLSEPVKEILKDPEISEKVLNVLLAACDAFDIDESRGRSIHKFQWIGIQKGLNRILDEDKSITTVIRAPTGSGKTFVFMVNAVLHFLLTGERTCLVFPTRILNEDMFRRLTRLLFHLSERIPDHLCTGGIFIGTRDPAYMALANPEVGEIMVQYEICPKCEKKGTVVATNALPRKTPIGVCKNCSHRIDYMFSPREITDYLPSITIATPDKLFYELTYNKYTKFTHKFIGAPVIECLCGCHETLLTSSGQKNSKIQCRNCNKTLETKNIIRKPIGHFVFDEVHSLYGLTAILISMFLNLLQTSQSDLGNKSIRFSYETGTATIANEKQLLASLTNRKVEQFPEKNEFKNYFEIKENSVRYRTNVVLPVGRSSMNSVLQSVLNMHNGLHRNGELKKEIKNITQNLKVTSKDYDFLLVYLFRKRDGYSLLKALKDHSTSQGFLLRTEFLSGEFSTANMIRVIGKLMESAYEVLLANLVISLGIDIEKLNNMIMLGIPKSVTELIQTIGRTGRRDGVPGHITIHCLPSIPRDVFFYRNFYEFMGDVEAYFDSRPVRHTNIYAAELILPNVIKTLLAAKEATDYRYCLTGFTNARFRDLNERGMLFLKIMKILVPILEKDLYRDLRKYLGNQKVRPYLDDLILQLGGAKNFVSNWFLANRKLLYGLRSTQEQILVEIKEKEVLDKLREQHKVEEDYFNEVSL